MQRAVETLLGAEHPALFRAAGVVCPHHGRFAGADRRVLDSAVEMQFNLRVPDDRNQAESRHALRLTLDRVAVGSRQEGSLPFKPLIPAKPFEIGADHLHELKLERQASEWRVFVDDALVGTVPLAKGSRRPEFRLVAEGGPAWFGDMAVEELAP